MQTIIIDELKRAIFSVKSIIIILSFLLIDYLASKYSSILQFFLQSSNTQVEVLFMGFTILGTFFSFILFSGILSKDIESGSIRYVLPYIKRTTLILSKYLAMIIYFVSLVIITLILLFIEKHFKIPWEQIFNMICFFAYIQALVLLLSSVLKERMSTFVGIVIGFALPILGLLSAGSHNLIYEVVTWLLPFRYLYARWDIFALIALTVAIIAATAYIFETREL